MTCPTCGDGGLVPSCYIVGHPLDGSECGPCAANFLPCPDCDDWEPFEEWTTVDDVFLVICCAMFLLLIGGLVLVLGAALLDAGVTP